MEPAHNEKGEVWNVAWAKLPKEELKKVAPHLFEAEILREEVAKRDSYIAELENKVSEQASLINDNKKEFDSNEKEQSELTEKQRKSKIRSEKMKKIHAERKARKALEENDIVEA